MSLIWGNHDDPPRHAYSDRRDDDLRDVLFLTWVAAAIGLVFGAYKVMALWLETMP